MGSCAPFFSKDQAEHLPDPMWLFQKLGNQGLGLGTAHPSEKN